MPLHVHQFPCLSDNYGFLLHDDVSGETAVIDTPDAEEILKQAEIKGWAISHIWNTHWHPDHAGGNQAVKDATGCTIIAPRGDGERIPVYDHQVDPGDTVKLGDHVAHVMDVSGHTLGHIAYHLPDNEIAFVGDSIFALGCGRMFEGTPEMMWSTMLRLRDLPDNTTLYCAHEYSQANARFATHIDPDNAALAEYSARIDALRAEDKPTVPTTLARELDTNPFLRADVAAMQAHMGHEGDAVATFAAIRSAKDNF
ncbi:hydroxyacylglutathione hydrolase [Alterisphingorhabdus coralli]|uniref:Hydroxyacylglutathione hydrolase n=1 Tax=Alterisphingorhabdus coralli TaxID=3071408 RepID=A0AA97F5B3_9SPHN|nr:hydroxyacylglutathione hydrolase [Parasphingorhabdus sp. SCSIO 66989]WOE74486.1 hydroxyacylglutathione hydrolase [Parasphingorhabdus sp. SCSIO 66989]